MLIVVASFLEILLVDYHVSFWKQSRYSFVCACVMFVLQAAAGLLDRRAATLGVSGGPVCGFT